MSIKDLYEKGKSWFELCLVHERELFVIFLVLLVAALAFGLGRLSRIENCREPVQIERA